MTRRERLMKTLNGLPVDRPPVCFYELNAIDEAPEDPDPFNVFNDPSWLPLLELTRARTDRIVLRGVPFNNTPPDPLEPLRTFEEWEEGQREYDREKKARMVEHIFKEYRTERGREMRKVG